MSTHNQRLRTPYNADGSQSQISASSKQITSRNETLCVPPASPQTTHPISSASRPKTLLLVVWVLPAGLRRGGGVSPAAGTPEPPAGDTPAPAAEPVPSLVRTSPEQLPLDPATKKTHNQNLIRVFTLVTRVKKLTPTSKRSIGRHVEF